MNKQKITNQRRTKIILFMLGIFLLTACGGGKERILDGVLEEKFNDLRALQRYVVLDYLDYDKIIMDENQTYADDPRYANQTPDGKVDWSKPQEWEERADLPQILDKVTVNGKAVQFPVSFEELGDEFAAFDKMDLKNLKEENLTLAFRNLENDYILRFHFMPSSKKEPYFVSIVRDDIDQIVLDILHDKEDGYKIIGFNTGIYKFPTTYDLRIDGIGIGNTFNEMYEKFGRPNGIEFIEDQKFVVYDYGDDNKNLTFWSASAISDPLNQTESRIYDNVITKVSIIYN